MKKQSTIKIWLKVTPRLLVEPFVAVYLVVRHQYQLVVTALLPLTSNKNLEYFGLIGNILKLFIAFYLQISIKIRKIAIL